MIARLFLFFKVFCTTIDSCNAERINRWFLFCLVLFLEFLSYSFQFVQLTIDMILFFAHLQYDNTNVVKMLTSKMLCKCSNPRRNTTRRGISLCVSLSICISTDLYVYCYNDTFIYCILFYNMINRYHLYTS